MKLRTRYVVFFFIVAVLVIGVYWLFLQWHLGISKSMILRDYSYVSSRIRNNLENTHQLPKTIEKLGRVNNNIFVEWYQPGQILERGVIYLDFNDKTIDSLISTLETKDSPVLIFHYRSFDKAVPESYTAELSRHFSYSIAEEIKKINDAGSDSGFE